MIKESFDWQTQMMGQFKILRNQDFMDPYWVTTQEIYELVSNGPGWTWTHRKTHSLWP
jgi:hypothetical protein